MTEPASASAGAPAAASDLENLPADLQAAAGSPGAAKRSAAEAFEADSVEDLKDDETTLDDVLVSPVTKKSKLLDEELPDVDDDEQFPQQEEDMDAELALGLENGTSNQDMDPETLNMEMENQDMELGNLNMENTERDAEELAPPQEEEEEEEEEEEVEDSEPPTSQNNEIDIVDVDDDEEEEEEEESGPGEFQQEEEEEEEGDDDEMETARAVTRAQNQREARQLLQQLDDSARSKLCLTALEKYGEELFYGHEDARDAILVDACAQDSVLSLMRDAIRVRDLYLRGSSAAAPVELDDDDEEEEETGGYEDDEEEEADEDEEEKPAASNEDDDDDVVIISEEEEEEEQRTAGSAAPNSTPSPSGEGQTGTYAEESNEDDDEEEDVGTEEKPESAEETASGAGENDESEGDEETKENVDATLGDVGVAGSPAAGASTSGATT
ncbi:hypothetical protein ON010_g11115 [Phytophthora cinnamomi]|nr:hypothetical protein ON010_g11115 [Phytophthora cinnamomi]